MIHGMFGGGWYFEDWARFLCEKGFRVYVITDLHFDENLKRISFYDYARRLGFLIKSLKNYGEIKVKPILLGHSMGGLLAQKIAEEYHPWINGIILVASAPPKGISSMSWSVAKAMLKHLPSLVFNLPLKIDKKSAFELIFNCLGGEKKKEYFLKKLVPESSIVAKQLAFSRISIDHEKVNCKSLVIAGIYDKLLPLRSQINIAQKYDSDYRSFLDGHMMMLRDEDEMIISSIYKWIDSNFIS